MDGAGVELTLLAQKPLRVVVADDHPVFRDGLVRVAQAAFPGAEVVEAATFAEILTLAVRQTPDLFLLDLLFPGMQPSRSIPELRSTYPQARLAIVSMIEDRGTVDAMMALGVDGYIAKTTPYERMISALHEVAAGKCITTVSNQPPLWADAALHTEDSPALTTRQREVLALLMKGHSNKEIGRALSISPFTVRIHVSALLRLLRAETRTEAAAIARSMVFEFETID
jgi:DNA-binding NarL/FixJ family response regulator